MIADSNDTIVALSSGAAAARRAIVRISGNECASILAKLLHGEAAEELLASPRATSREVSLDLGQPFGIFPGRVYFWPTARAYTGQPSAELHVIGCLPIVEFLIQRICQFGARPAERGEFTLRSFLAGKLDLTQAEGVLGVIEADNPQKLDAALQQLGGNLMRLVSGLRNRLLEVTAHLEAGLDFAEEGISFLAPQELNSQLSDIQSALVELHDRMTLRTGFNRVPRVVLAGVPNSGKSSLFNALLGIRRTIVSDQAGTTRDAIGEYCNWNGCQLELMDTAGLESIEDGTPRGLAQKAATLALEQADLVLYCIECTEMARVAHVCNPGDLLRREMGDPRWFEPITGQVIIVGTKLDLLQGATEWLRDAREIPRRLSDSFLIHCSAPETVVLTSSKTCVGQDELKLAIAEVLSKLKHGGRADFVHQTAVRCRQCVTNALDSIERAIAAVQDEIGEEFVASELRLALDELSAIIGEVHTEDLLGEIFSRFCIGK